MRALFPFAAAAAALLILSGCNSSQPVEDSPTVVDTTEAPPAPEAAAPAEASCEEAIYRLPKIAESWELLSVDAFEAEVTARYGTQLTEFIAGLPAGYCVAQFGSTFQILVPAGLDGAGSAALAASAGLELASEDAAAVKRVYASDDDLYDHARLTFTSGPWVQDTGLPDAVGVSISQ